MFIVTSSQSPANRGFTLIELMITVAVVAILSTIAYASYTKSVLKSHRTDAKTALLDIAGREERLYSTTTAYSNVPTDVGYAGTAGTAFAVGSGYYTVLISLPSATQFTIKATPTGMQTADTLCTWLQVDQTGAETASDPSCW